jgi:hypothetical protein
MRVSPPKTIKWKPRSGESSLDAALRQWRAPHATRPSAKEIRDVLDAQLPRLRVKQLHEQQLAENHRRHKETGDENERRREMRKTAKGAHLTALIKDFPLIECDCDACRDAGKANPQRWTQEDLETNRRVLEARAKKTRGEEFSFIPGSHIPKRRRKTSGPRGAR